MTHNPDQGERNAQVDGLILDYLTANMDAKFRDLIAGNIARGEYDGMPLMALAHFAFARLATQSPAAEPGQSFQARFQTHLVECFGPEVAADKQERNRRFAEEACELLQACEFPKDVMHQMVDWVFDKPSKDAVRTEISDVSNTLAALASAHGVDMDQAREEGLAKFAANIDRIRAKWLNKPAFTVAPISKREAELELRRRCLRW